MLNENNQINIYKSFDYNEKKKIVYRIQCMKSKRYYYNLFKIIESMNVKFTINSNGIFFNINNLSNQMLCKIESFLDDYELKKNFESDISNCEMSDSILSTDY